MERVRRRAVLVAGHFNQRATPRGQATLGLLDQRPTNLQPASVFGDDQRGDSADTGWAMEHRRDMDGDESKCPRIVQREDGDLSGAHERLEPIGHDVDW